MKNPEKLLDLLSQDARLSTAQLAAMTGSSEDEVVSQLKHYEKNGTILGYKALVDWDKTDRESVTALIEVKITPQKGMGFDEIARLFDGVAGVEKAHEARYLTFVGNIEEEMVFQRGEEMVWICRNCGFVYRGKKAPKACPVCRYPQSYFELKAQNY